MHILGFWHSCFSKYSKTLFHVLMPLFHSNREFTFYYPCEDKVSCHGIELSLSPGQYLLEVYGASNGFFSGYEESCGGYARGILILNETINASIYIGSSGIVKNSGSGNTGHAFNGGGSGNKNNNYGCSGGGFR